MSIIIPPCWKIITIIIYNNYEKKKKERVFLPLNGKSLSTTVFTSHRTRDANCGEKLAMMILVSNSCNRKK